MPVSLAEFSRIAARQDVRDSGIVRVDSRQDLKLNQSRFRLVRWVRDSGIGKRLSNRNTINTFISSLQNHYDEEVTSRMDFRPLRELRSRGKPLHVRDIKAAISEADMVADDIKLVKSSNIEGLVDENIAGVAYKTLPGGEELAREVRSKVDIAVTQEKFVREQSGMAALGSLSGGSSLSSAKGWVDIAVINAQKDIFLTGYGVETTQGLKYDKLQKLIDKHPQIESLNVQYGISFNASSASGALYGDLSEKLSNKLAEVMENPERLPGEGQVKERVEQVISQAADRVVDEFIQERAEALERLSELHADGEISSEDMASYSKDGPRSLVDVVLHHRIPPGMLSRLYALRSDTPDNLGDLASTGHPMQHKIQVLGQFSEALSGIYTGISDTEKTKYMGSVDSRLNYTEDCGRFLLEGKLSTDADTAIRHAVKKDPPGSNLLELCQGIAAMRGGMYEPGANRDHWAAAADSIEKMSAAALVLLGPDTPPLMGEYTQRAGNVLTAMRNCGMDVPPPDNPEVEQSGKGAFSRPALEIAQKELDEIMAEEKVKSKIYPEFPDEAVRDLNRADFVVGDKRIRRGDVPEVVESIRKFCVDDQGNPDETLRNIVAELVYQRSNSLVRNRFASGFDFNENDLASRMKTAPFIGQLDGNFQSTYSVSKSGTDSVLVHIRTEGTPDVLAHYKGNRRLDNGESRLEYDIAIEINARDYSAKVTGMNYDYRFVPTGEMLL